VTALRQRMLEDLQIRHYSPSTIRIYLHSVAEFARHFRKPPDQLGSEHIRQYQLFLMKEKQVSLSSYIQMVCALRFLYTQTLSRKIGIERIPFPRRERKLPVILSQEEVKALLEAPRTLRHRALLAVLYGCDVVDDAKNVATLCKSGKLCGALRITEVGSHELTRKLRRCVSRDADDFPAGRG
jgi:integrase/recombinase XerD